MTSIISDIVRHRARSVISRFLNQRGEPKVTSSTEDSIGVQKVSIGDASTANPPCSETEAISLTAQQSKSSALTTPPKENRIRFPPLPDDYDLEQLCVVSLLDYLSELSFSRELKLTTARCYRRWLAAYLDSEGHADASKVRNWVIPHSPEYYEMLLMATDRIESEREALLSANKKESKETQLDMFTHQSAPTKELDTNASGLTSCININDISAEAHIDRDEILQMMFETQQEKESIPIAEYDYISSDVTDILIAALTSKTSRGNPRYKHGQLSAALFRGTIMLGLRPREWQHANFIEMHTDPQSLITLGPVVEVFTLKQQRRRDDNPLREKRLLVLDTNYSDHEIDFIRNLIEIIHSYGDAIESTLKNIRMTLNTVWKRLIKDGHIKPSNKIQKRGRASSVVGRKGSSDGYGVNLYTARHVFAEEIKRSGLYTRFELAAMIGHTTTINQRYYTLGKKFVLRSYEHSLPRPWPGDAQDIELWCDDIVKTLTPQDIERLRSDGVFYPTSRSEKELAKIDSLEDFFNP